MSELGSDVKQETNEYLIFKSICHNSEKYKLYYYISSKYFFCYSECHNMSIYDLIMKIKKCEFKDAFNLLKDIVGNLDRPFIGFGDNEFIEDLDDIEVPELKEIDKPFLYNMYLKKEIKEWSEEGISYEVQQKFKIRYDLKGNRAIIPVFDDNGKTIGIRTRNFNPRDIERRGKYIPLFYGDKCYNFPTSSMLYGLNITKQNILKYKKIIITEGEKSVLKGDEYYPNGNCCVAMLGSNLSKVHKKIILDLANGDKSFEVIMAMDKEFEIYDSQERIEYEKKIIKNLDGLNQYCKCSYIVDKEGLLDMKDSPLDKGKKIFESLIKSRKLIN
ncbi:hypothetical protein [Peptostreptococcus porci]|uniref:hypothetical protein n=1 Tax=Peptostreptococcus porci TaxID=2652282 RepID=UPI002A7FFC2D|nr:hypothetical protein [Peptostreptococcus porci]MDY4127720.1 hypothetical protein [Peptostreptococcus porci]